MLTRTIVVVLGILSSIACFAQTFTPGAQSPIALHAAAQDVYRMEASSAVFFGCVPPSPCLCLVENQGELKGTFQTRRQYSNNPSIRTWQVEEVNWLSVGDHGEHRIVGSGRLSIGTPGVLTVIQIRLELTLRVDDGEPMQYDSGWQALSTNEGRISLHLSPTQLDDCIGYAFQVDAAKLLPGDLARYTLDADSLFSEGCFDPCDCPIAFAPIAGKFALVPLFSDAAIPYPFEEYALVSLRASSTQDAPTTPPFVRARGSGIYRIFRSLAPLDSHRLQATLTLNRNAPNNLPQPIDFDSGWAPLSPPTFDAPPERVDIDIAENAFHCFDRVFMFRATRVNNIP